MRVRLAWPVVAFRTDNAPLLNGELDDACWDGRGRVVLENAGPGHTRLWQLVEEGFMHQWPTNSDWRKEGAVFLRYDAKNLYVGAYAPEWTVNNYGDGWTIHLSDADQALRDLVARSIRFTVITNSLYAQGASCGVREFGGAERAPRTNDWSVSVRTDAGGVNFRAEFRIGWEMLAAEGFDCRRLVMNSYGPGGIRLRQANGLTGVSSRFMPVWYDMPENLTGQHYRPYRIRLHFAEPGLAAPGERVFDVSLQGKVVLSEFDIAAEAGGSWRGVVKEFQTFLGDSLEVGLLPRTGEPLICGIEVIGEYAHPNLPPDLSVAPLASTADVTAGQSQLFAVRTSSLDPEGDALSVTWWKNGVRITSGIGSASWYISGWTFATTTADAGEHTVEAIVDDGQGNVVTRSWRVRVLDPSRPAPVVELAVTPRVGTAPFEASFTGNASASSGAVIVSYEWDFGDGQGASGAAAQHVYDTPGVYQATLWATDSRGMTGSAMATLYVFAPAGPLWQGPDTDGDGLPDWWETLYFGGPMSADAQAIAANNVHTVLETFLAGLNPHDPSSRLAIFSMEQHPSGVRLRFDTVLDRVYRVRYRDRLDGTSSWQTLTTLTGDGRVKEIHDPNAGAATQRFYQVQVETP